MAKVKGYQVTEIKDNGGKGRTWQTATGEQARDIEQRERRLLGRGSSAHFKVTELR